MEIGKIWPGWEVSEYIGEGSFGKVYKIIREDFGHLYESALKVITIPANKGELASVLNDGFDEESATMYFHGMVEDIVEEFVLMSQLRGNSNIVSYEDHAVIPHEGEIGWDIYIRMELLTPLFDYVKTNPLSIRDVIQLGMDICQGLEICQKYNIIHRDIKPENIFVSNLGQYKLGDFGIARQLEKTSSGLSKKGTYSYMAPEVYKGEEYNSTVDIYSLGIVLYRFLNNNRTPFLPPYPNAIRFSDKDKANIMRFSGEKMDPPCNAKGRLSEIILKACAYHPKERYESARKMRQALQEVFYTEQETKMIYPSGDTLENDVNLYASTTHGSKDEEEISMLQIKEEGLNQTEESTIGLLGKGREEALKAAKEQEREEKKEERPKEPEETKGAKRQEEEENQDKKKDRESAPSGRKNKKIAIVFCAAASVLCIFFVLTMQKGGKTTVPDFLNMPFEKAKEAAEEYGLAIETKEAFSDTVEKGIVFSQSKKAGAEVERESVIEVTVSLGEETVKVPGVTGMNQEEAKSALEENGFVCEIGEAVYSDTDAEGTVLSQNPESGTDAEKNTAVTLTVSKGTELFEVPGVVGLSQEEAKAALKQAGFKVKITEEEGYNDEVAAGAVVSQDINGGERMPKKTKICLVISRGKQPEEKKEAPKSSAGKTTPPPASPPSNPEPAAPQQPAQAPPAQTPPPSAESIDSWDLIN